MPRSGKIQLIKYAPPPPELPVYGRIDPAEVSFIGRTNYAAALEEKKFIFGLKRVDRRNHVYMIGKSGMGKSKLLELLIRQDIAQGHGLCLIDPHGDIIDSLLDFIPAQRVGDVALIDPIDARYPVSFNPFARVHPSFKHQLTQGVIEIMAHRFGTAWTPRLEHVLRFACLALLDYPHATMRGLILLLTDSAYRARVLPHIEDDMVKRFWGAEFDQWTERFDGEAVVPLVNTLSQFLSDPLLRNIFSQEENKISFERCIREKRIVLINLAKGRLGEENARFLGGICVTKLKQAGMARAIAHEAEGHDFYVYMDEFHDLATGTFETLFAEARKYGLCFTLAHQYAAQLSSRLHAAVLGNTGTSIVFRIAGEDAERMKSEFAPIFDVKDMINLGMQEFYIKMIIDGEAYDPFSAESLGVFKAPHPSFRTDVVAASRARYALQLEMAKRLAHGADVSYDGGVASS